MRTREAIDAFLNAGRARGLSPRTVQWYAVMLRGFALGNTQLPRKPEALERYLGGLRVGDESRHGYYRALKAFYSWCEQRYGAANPLRGLIPPRRRKKLPRTLSPVEIGYLFLVPLSERDRAVIWLLLDTGIRAGELVGLKVEDIGMDSILVTGKTGSREVPISDMVRRLLLEVAGPVYVFPGYSGHLTTHHVYHLVRHSFEASGMKGRKMGPHTLRHTFGRQFIMAGGDAFSLQRILGHSNIQTTRIYAELNLEDVIRQHHKYTPIRAALAPTQGRLISEAESIIRTMQRGGDR